MKSFLFNAMVGVLAFGAAAGTLSAAEEGDSIEIFVGGRKYDSVEGYRDEEKKNEELTQQKTQAAQDVSTPAQDNISELREMFDDALRSSNTPLDLKFDPTKMKTVYIQPPPAAVEQPVAAKEFTTTKDPFRHSYLMLSQVGFNDGIHQVISDFKVSKRWKGGAVSAGELEEVLQKSLGESSGPILLISDDNKLRVMQLEPQDNEVSSDDSDAAAP
jgi:hypothetical protein